MNRTKASIFWTCGEEHEHTYHALLSFVAPDFTTITTAIHTFYTWFHHCIYIKRSCLLRSIHSFLQQQLNEICSDVHMLQQPVSYACKYIKECTHTYQNLFCLGEWSRSSVGLSNIFRIQACFLPSLPFHLELFWAPIATKFWPHLSITPLDLAVQVLFIFKLYWAS